MSERQVFQEKERLFLARMGSSEPDPGELFSREDLRGLLTRSRLGPLLYWRMTREGLSFPSEETKNELKGLYLENIRRHSLHRKAVFPIIRSCDQAGVDVIVLKSPFLGLRIYGDEGVRNSGCDTDILIREEQFPEAMEVFKDRGYIVPPIQRALVSAGVSFSIRPPVGSLFSIVDVHLRPSPRILIPGFPLDIFWDRSWVFEEREGVAVRVFSDEALFLYLCCMFYYELVELKRLRNILDLRFFLKERQSHICYEGLAETINASRMNGYVLFAHKALKEAFGEGIPAEGFVEGIGMSPLREKALHRAIVNYWDSPKRTARVVKYMWEMMVFSKGYATEIARKASFLYGLSYELYLGSTARSRSVRSALRHAVFFLKRSLRRYRQGEELPGWRT